MRAMHRPAFGCAEIDAEPRGFYQPAPGGTLAVVLAVHDWAGEIADIVSWLPSDPARWWVRTGAIPVLGEAEIQRAAFLGLPLYLFGTPHGWLLNHAKGGRWPAACVLDWSLDPRIEFNGVRIVCTKAVGNRLADAQRRHDRPLSVTIAALESVRVAA